MRNINEEMALKSVLEFISVSDLLKYAMNGFADTDTAKSQENADIIFKAMKVFL